MEVQARVSKIFLAIVFSIGAALSLYPKPGLGIGTIIILYGAFLATQKVEIKNGTVHYKSIFGTKSIIKLESIEVTDLLFLNSVVFVGTGGSKIVIANVAKLEKIKAIGAKYGGINKKGL